MYSLRWIALAWTLSLLAAAPAQGTAGDLDQTFSGDGKVTTHLGEWEGVWDLALQPDGKLVTVGESHNGDYSGGNGHLFALSRHNPDGTLDTSFSDDGKQTTAIDGLATAQAVALQSDGKIVIAGDAHLTTTPFGGNFGLARYHADGSLDTSFGGDGIVITDFFSPAEAATGVAIQPDGKVVAVGYTYPNGPPRFVLTRYNADGSLDTSFSGDGQQTTLVGVGEVPRDVVIQPDGRILAVGGGHGFALARYNADGSLDTSFSGDGIQLTSFGTGSQEIAWGVALEPDGQIAVAGAARDFALARYNANGSLDTSFSGDGRQTTDFGSPYEGAMDLALQPDGKLIAAGNTGDGNHTYRFALARYAADGSPDLTFSGNGALTTSFGGGTGRGAWGVALQPDGMIVAAGDHQGDFALARYEGDETEPPQTTIDSGPLGPVADAQGQFDFSSTEEGSTFECRLDGAPFAACTSPTPVGPVTPGRHTFEVRATDVFGNTDPTPATSRFTLVTCTITGSGSGETLTGTAGADVICGLGGNDKLEGLDGDDTLVGGAGNDKLFGGDDDDTLGGNADVDLLDGGPGGDVSYGGSASDRVSYATRTAHVKVTIGANADDGETGEGDDVRGDVERVRGGDGDDQLVGDAGPNTLIGGAGIDTLSGGGGDDALQGMAGADLLQGGAGRDTATYGERTNGVTVTVGAGADDGEPGEGDTVSADIERVHGGRGADNLTGSGLANALLGGGGADTLTGGAGEDTLNGGDDDDTLFATDGERDTLVCGAGADTIHADAIDHRGEGC